MSFMKGDLLTKTRKLVKGLAKKEPLWLKAMEQAPPVTFPRAERKNKQIILPEDVYVKTFFKKHPCAGYEDAIKINAFDPPPARIFANRVLELKAQGASEENAIAVADAEYKSVRKERKAAYKRLKEVRRLQGKSPPENPFPSAIKEIQAEERKYVRDRFFDPEVRKNFERMKEEKAASFGQEIKPAAQAGASGGGLVDGGSNDGGNVRSIGWGNGGGGGGRNGGWGGGRNSGGGYRGNGWSGGGARGGEWGQGNNGGWSGGGARGGEWGQGNNGGGNFGGGGGNFRGGGGNSGGGGDYFGVGGGNSGGSSWTGGGGRNSGGGGNWTGIGGGNSDGGGGGDWTGVTGGNK